jgi:teichuronic acid biosynthesis glycosyltransferase TuaG
VYNAEKYLDETVQSVLAQTYPLWELLIVIDCKSTDRSLEIAKKWESLYPQIQVLTSSQNLGVANNRNLGIQNAKGEFTAFLDSDDLWLPKKLEYQVLFMLEKNIDFSFHSYQQMDSKGTALAVHRLAPHQVSYTDLLKSNVIGCLTVMIKTSVLEKFSFMVDQPHEDFLLWLDILKKTGSAYGLSEVLARYRILPNSRSGDKKRAALERWSIYRNVLKLSLVESLYYFVIYACSAVRQRLGSSGL